MPEGMFPFRNRPAVWQRWLVALLVLLLCVLGATYAWHNMHPGVSPTPAPQLADSKPTVGVPYRNVRPEVRYVGDAVCACCHADIAQTYRHHPMARTLTPVRDALKNAAGDKVVHKALKEMAVELSVETRDGRMFQRLRGQDPKSTLAHEDEIHYLLGSGSRGQSALIERDGLLFQSPISWFRAGQRWDLAPGYRYNLTFDRPIRPACVFCHANRSLPVAGTENRYHEPIFDGFGIGCERCHGPGQLHVERQRQGQAPDGPDDTIVNPANLPPSLREAVCQQCHLTGTVRVERAGRDTYDYRPGLPLEDFWAIFVPPADRTNDSKAVGEVEQMYASRCFQASQGRLGCISCHDPHVKPTDAQKVTFYRSRCLACHTPKSCTLSPAERHHQSRQDDCVQCHMPKFANSDIAHSASTDHRIPRRRGEHRSSHTKSARTGGLLVNFYRDLLDPHDPGLDRDLGVALVSGARAGLLPATQAAQQAGVLLTRLAADDAPAHEARAWALWMLDRQRDALAEAQNALHRNPGNEALLRTAAAFCGQMGRVEQSLELDRRILALNPWDADVHGHIAELMARRGRWDEVEKECRAALHSNPTQREARRYLVLCMLEKDRPDLATEEMNTLLSLRRADATQLRKWFNRQMERWRHRQR